ncbi:restriction endonuclease S subunit [Rheinheimera sp. A13L]|uniref:restriction endonuclease subunit S n=1 Tax=Rheinheimera sp. A13L TaxID=506534 RepID=UPI000212564D|nr:restriction endonuclease subunit S [Rheinheimera sp. A13L]EGM76937.1 restriction endonuclease S subunit [Rheinheimera sp. A13L]
MALARSPAEIVQESSKEVLGKHPSWERVELDHIANILNGYAFKSALFSSDSGKGKALIRIRDVGKDRTNTYYSGEFDEQYIVKKGDLLVGMDGDFNAAIWQGEDALLNQRVCKIDVNTELYNKKFLFYVIQPYLNAIHAETSSVTVKHLSSGSIGQIPLPLPPLNAQTVIVDKIEELFSHIDAGVEGLKQTKAKLQQYRQSVLKDAVTGKLTEKWRVQNAEKLEPADKLLERILTERRKNWEQEQLKIYARKGSLPKGGNWKDKYKEPNSSFDSNPPFELPEGWQWCYFESIGFVSGGLTKSIKKNTNQRKIPYLRVANVYANELRLDEIHEISVSETELDRVLLQDKDLLIVEGNGSPEQIGRIAIWDNSVSPCVHQNHLIKVRLIEKTLSEFIVFWLMSLYGRDQIKAVASSTSGLYTLSISKISSLPIPLPPLEEAREISSLVTEKLAAAFKTEEELDHKIKLSARLKAAILSKAFTGRLVCNEQTEETAEELLERILDEKLKSFTNEKVTQRKMKKKAKIMNKRPIFEVIKESKKALKVEEIFELAGFQSDVSPESIEVFYQELKEVSSRAGIEVTPYFLDKKKQGDKFEYKEVN